MLYASSVIRIVRKKLDLDSIMGGCKCISNWDLMGQENNFSSSSNNGINYLFNPITKNNKS